MTRGRPAGYRCSEKTKRKASRSMKRWFETHEHPMKGKKRTRAAKKRIADGVREYARLHGSPRAGARHTAAAKSAISARLKGRKKSAAHRARISAAISAWHRRKSAETRPR